MIIGENDDVSVSYANSENRFSHLVSHRMILLGGYPGVSANIRGRLPGCPVPPVARPQGRYGRRSRVSGSRRITLARPQGGFGAFPGASFIRWAGSRIEPFRAHPPGVSRAEPFRPGLSTPANPRPVRMKSRIRAGLAFARHSPRCIATEFTMPVSKNSEIRIPPIAKTFPPCANCGRRKGRASRLTVEPYLLVAPRPPRLH